MKSFCIIGLGRFGQTLAAALVRNGHQVLVIDENEDAVAPLADYMTNAVIGDPTSENLLRASGAAEYDCVVIALSNNINKSILIAMLLKDMGAPYLVARANSDLERRVLEKVGADRIVFPEQEMGEKLASMLESSNILERLQFSNEYSIVELPMPLDWVGKNLIELSVRANYGVNVIGITDEKDRMNISPNPKEPLKAGHTVTVIGENKKIDRLISKNS
jgi:trk system potassium uptake protein TrkA